VDTATGSTAEFWEVAPGQVFFTESGGPNTRPAARIKGAAHLSNLWNAVAPGAAMPDDLAAANAKTRHATADTLAPAAGDPPPFSKSSGQPATPDVSHRETELTIVPQGTSTPPGDPNDFCDATWFYNNLAYAYCSGTEDSYWSHSWCWYDRWGPSVSGSNMIFDEGALCDHNSTNDLILTITRGGSGNGSWSVPSASWRTWSFFTGQSCPCSICGGSCSFNLYNLSIVMNGTSGDVQFAGGVCQPGNPNCSSE
jgi:hypothetical protein